MSVQCIALIKKRETMYIKNQEWAKDEKLEQVDKLLKRVENKQLKNIQKWTDENPNFMESEKLQEEYIDTTYINYK